MRRLVWTGLLLTLAGTLTVTAAASRHATPKTLGKVVGTPTGDTLLVKIGKAKPALIRILGVRSPSGADCYARDAAAATRSLALNERVTLVGNLKNGRAYVTLPNGEDLGRLLLKRGVAQLDIWSPQGAREQAYAPVQREAERTLQGMWRGCAADLEVRITGPDSGFPGQLLSYSVTVKNAGPLVARAADLQLRPGNYSEFVHRVTPADACTVASWMARCSISNLAPGTTVSYTVVLRAVNFGALSARADATLLGCISVHCGDAPLLDANLESNRASVVTILPGGGYERKCDTSYPSDCIPVPPPDLDCEDFLPLKNFPVKHDVAKPDDHHLDGNHDGIGCQEEDY
jgi:endonuclease YncB( thermonuclease family)